MSLHSFSECKWTHLQYLIDRRGNPAQSEESLQLQDAEVGHTDALYFPRGLQCFHPLQTQDNFLQFSLPEKNLLLISVRSQIKM